MTADERVQAVVKFGFTERQARFLVAVMLHSGVCLLRQYTAFAGIVHGQKTRKFFAKLVRHGTPLRTRVATTEEAFITCSTSRSIEPSARPTAGFADPCPLPVSWSACPCSMLYSLAPMLSGLQPVKRSRFTSPAWRASAPTKQRPNMSPDQRGERGTKCRSALI